MSTKPGPSHLFFYVDVLQNKKENMETSLNKICSYLIILEIHISKMFDTTVHQTCETLNGGFFVLEPAVLDLIEDDQTIWEAAPLMNLAAENELQAYQHKGFWQAMDTLRDKTHLEELWRTANPPWKRWE